jgi:galactokinase
MNALQLQDEATFRRSWMSIMDNDKTAAATLLTFSRQAGMDLSGGRIRRTSSRLCLGVEHGDYNGTDLFGVGTDRFIWMAYKPNGTSRMRFFDGKFAADGILDFKSGEIPPPRHPSIAHTWARFPYGCDYVLRKAGFQIKEGFDAVLFGNIPGGGMSRSASLTLNLLLTMVEVNRLKLGGDRMQIIDLAQAVENEYIGSPCGQLDQIMIYFAKAGMGTHYSPKTRAISHVPLGDGAPDFRFVSLDTGTVRPGLEKSTYKLRRAECDEFAALAGRRFGFSQLAAVNHDKLFKAVLAAFGATHPDHCDRLRYLYHAGKRFKIMLKAWRSGDIATVGGVFRADGVGLRDLYKISGPELESMCDIVRTVPGVYGERMLGGGDKGAAGAIVAARSVKQLQAVVAAAYPRSRPELADKFAVHSLKLVDGVNVLDGLL